jgi:hypothetical protein
MLRTFSTTPAASSNAASAAAQTAEAGGEGAKAKGDGGAGFGLTPTLLLVAAGLGGAVYSMRYHPRHWPGTVLDDALEA